MLRLKYYFKIIKHYLQLLYLITSYLQNSLRNGFTRKIDFLVNIVNIMTFDEKACENYLICCFVYIVLKRK